VRGVVAQLQHHILRVLHAPQLLATTTCTIGPLFTVIV
jgi:hypothetical protein